MYMCDFHHCIDTIRSVDPHCLSYTFGLFWIHPHRVGSVYVVSLSYCQLMSVQFPLCVCVCVSSSQLVAGPAITSDKDSKNEKSENKHKMNFRPFNKFQKNLITFEKLKCLIYLLKSNNKKYVFEQITTYRCTIGWLEIKYPKKSIQFVEEKRNFRLVYLIRLKTILLKLNEWNRLAQRINVSQAFFAGI